jgi:hypothetical protein
MTFSSAVANSISIPASGGEEGTLVGSLDGPLLSLMGEDMVWVDSAYWEMSCSVMIEGAARDELIKIEFVT